MTVSGLCAVRYANDDLKFRRLFRWLCKPRRHAIDPIPNTCTIIITRMSCHNEDIALVPTTSGWVGCVCISLQTHQIAELVDALSVLATNDGLIIGFTPIVLPQLIPDKATFAYVPIDVCTDMFTIFYSLKVGNYLIS